MTTPPASSAPATPAPSRPRRALKPRPSAAARRVGYLFAIAFNVVLLVAIHAWPGWRKLPFLTEETTEVLPWVNTMIGLTIALNVLWLVADPRWFRAAGDVVSSAVGAVVTVRILTVFPFAFDDDGVAWEPWVRFILWVAIVGSAIGVIAGLVQLVRALGAAEEPAA